MFWRNKKKPNKISLQYFSEEVFNVVSHLTALLVFSFMSGAMLATTDHFWTSLIYCFATINLYASSMMYHYFEKIKVKQILRILDHSSINLLIAASYTPFMVYLNQTEMLTAVWVIAGMNTMEMLFSKGVNKIFLARYLLMGWMIVLLFPKLWTDLNPTSFWFLVSGGMAYTVGTYFFANDRRKYFHSIWHVFTAVGTLLHFFSVLNIYN
jgi:hemolysin III